MEDFSPGMSRSVRRCLWACALLCATILPARQAWGYVEAGYALGRIITESTIILEMRVEKLDREKNLIIYRKIRDIKGKFTGDTIKHSIGKGGFHPREWTTIMAWAEVGQTAMFFSNGSAAEVCINNYWYQVYPGDWWSMSHGEPYLLRAFSGRPEKLSGAVASILGGQEVVVPCMVDGDKNALQLRTAKIQRMKVSLKILDYNPKRDFAGWGGEDFRPLLGMPGFTHLSTLGRMDPGAGGAAVADFDGDGKPDVCLFGDYRAVLLQSSGGALNEVPLPVEGGAHAAAWADFNNDGRPDLLLATPSGPKLLLNMKGKFRDVSTILPRQSYYNLTAAAWIDYDGDGRPDVLLADGFRGLRLYRNKGGSLTTSTAKMGPWYYIGPFDSTEGKGFDTVYPPEKGIDLSQQYPGKNGEKAVWKEGAFRDGEVNSLALFKEGCNENVAGYVYRELEVPEATELTVSLGSDDTLTVWLNGAKLLAENVGRGCEPDQAMVTLKLKPGKNALLLKVCNGPGPYAFYFAPKEASLVGPELFEDVSDKVGLGANGIAGTLKGDHLAVADVNGDGRQDFLYSAGTGVLVLNTPQGFVEAKDCGISYQPGRIAPVFGDFDGDKQVDLFVPQPGRCKLFRNDKGRFTDVTAKAGALAEPIPHATCAAWTDFSNRGRLDLLVGCLKGPNRYFRNKGDGTFADATEEIGLHQQVFNTRGLAVLDINKDGVLDVLFNNEGQEATALLGNPARLAAPPAPGR
jgi:hypothetical protein